MEIHFRGIYSKEEYLAASKLCRRPVARKGQFIIDTWAVLAAIGGLLIIAGIVMGISGQPLMAFLAAIGLLLIAYGQRLRGIPAKLWEQSKAVAKEWLGKVTEDGVQISTSIGQAFHPWVDLTGYGEHQDIIVIFHGPTIAISIPRRFVATAEEWQTLRREVSQRLPVTHSVRTPPSIGLRLNIRHVIVALLLLAIILLILLSRTS